MISLRINQKEKTTMVQEKYITKRQKGKHLTLWERGKIEAYWNMGLSKTEIALRIGVSRRTIQREIQRGWVSGLLTSDLDSYDTYVAQTAQRKYEEKQKNKEGSLKIGKNHKLMKYLEWSMLQEKNSPYVALEKAKKEHISVNICLKTLYNYIHQNLFVTLTEKEMAYRKTRRTAKKLEKSIRKKGGRSIEERAQSINAREELGHIEMDTVVGKQGSSSCLLVLTDRKSRLEIIRKLEAKTSAHVVKAVRDILRDYPGWIKTITSDNGSEFMNADAIESLGIPYFYAHSYCSWERGSNENNNKLIRRHLPKGTDIGEVSEETIKEIEEWINTYPRKLWNGKSSKEIHTEEFTKYVS